VTAKVCVQFQDAFSNFAALEEQAQDAIAAMLCYDGTAPAQVCLDVLIFYHNTMRHYVHAMESI
jgi:hypothetical protein